MRTVAQALRAIGRLPRRALRRVPARASGAPVIVLLYHRIAEDTVDPWGLCVSPVHFEAHLGVLRRRGPVLPLAQAAASLRAGQLPRRASVITFDDGYADNLHVARPLLVRNGVPGTVFLTTGDGGREREFWWDELERVLLRAGTLPRRLRLDVGTDAAEWDLGDAAEYAEADERCHHAWRAWSPPPTPRHAAYLGLWRRLITLPAVAQRLALDGLLVWAGQEPVVRLTHRAVSWEEARALVEGGLVSAGAHTVTHPVLPQLTAREQVRELRECREAIEAHLGHPVRTCAYPYGRYTAETLAAARASGFETGCTTEARGLDASGDPLAIPRFAVADVGERAFAASLSVPQNS